MDISFLEWNEDEPLEIDPKYFYEEEDDGYEILEDGGEAIFTLQEIVKYCLKPTIFDGAHHVGRILLCCLIFRISSLTFGISEKLVHLLSISTGIYLLFLMFNSVWYYMVIASVLGYCILKAANKCSPEKQGYITFFTVLAVIMSCEFFLSPHEWHSIRGCQMLIAMRIISVSFDFSTKSPLPDPVSILSYLLCPGTVIFGPWISYQDFNTNLKNSSINAQWVCKIIISAALGMFFLSISTCWAQYFIPQGSWKWSIAYRDALSFRSSHYFVSYISEASSVLAGVYSQDLWRDSVTKPHYIEIPRSLVEIVIYWNMPLHHWFKHYVFKPVQPFGNGVAVIITYIVSAVLHGVNFQLSAVLLSLGYYTYVEHSIRLKLANIFNACIGARMCKKCDHKYQSSHPVVIITNLFLSSLTLFHLAYLGLMFDSQSSGEDTGYDMLHTLNKWKHLGFASHWLMLTTHIIHCVI